MSVRLWAVGLALCAAACDDEGGDSGEADAAPDGSLVADAALDASPVDAMERLDGAVDGAVVADMDLRPPDMGCACPGRQTCDDEGACVEPEGCMGNEDCVAPRACVEGVCEDRCREDADCPGALACDVEAQSCVEAVPCFDARGCLGDRLCFEGACADSCVDVGCPGNQDCVEATGRCTAPDRCEADEDCPGAACVEGGCVQGCAEAADCPGAQRCEGGGCVSAEICADAVDCVGDLVCDDGACVAPCDRAACDGELECDLDSGLCVCAGDACGGGCEEAADCPGAQRCEAGVCVEPEVCNGPLDCAGDRICDDGRCAAPCGVAGCPGALVCDGETGGCSEAVPCRGDDGCRGDRFCAGGVCLPPCAEAADCPGALQCRGGRCVEGVCFGDEDCARDRLCVDNGCVDGCGDERPCRGTQVCEDGACHEGEGCADDRDCVAGRRCHPGGQVCVDVCEPGDCRGGLVCGEDGLCGDRGACQDDAHCLGERLCRLGTCRTVRCEAHRECPEGEVCVEFQCRPEAPDECECLAGARCRNHRCEAPGPCADDDACRGDWMCAEGACARCQLDGDCPGQSTCVDGRCAEANCGGCLPGRVCGDDGFCEPAPCDEDALAPNHAANEAVPLGAMLLGDLSACDGRDDWFRVATEDNLVVIARFAVERAPLRLELYGVEDVFRPLDVNEGQPGESWVESPEPGEYLVRVQRPPGGALAYALDVRTGFDCVEDAWERPHRNDERAGARTVGVGLVEGTLCGEDTDWFLYGGAAPAQLDLSRGEAEIDVDGRGPPTVVQPGEAIRVSGAPGPWRFRLSGVRDPAARCAAAAPVEPGVTDASVVEGPDDFAPDACFPMGQPDRVFRVDLEARGTLRAQIQGGLAMSPLALYSDCEAAPIECAAGAGGLEARALEAGSYYLVVDGPLEGDLSVEFEGDFACDGAVALPVGVDVPVMLAPAGGLAGGCVGPQDAAAVLVFDLAERSAVTVSARGEAQAAVALRGACGDAQSEVGCEQGFDPETSAVLEAGRWHVVVAGAGMATVRLETEAAIAPGVADECDGAVTALRRGDSVRLVGDTGGAVDDLDASAHCGVAAGGRDQIVRFRVAEAGMLNAELAAVGDYQGYLVLLDGACGGGGVCGTDINVSLQAQVVPGEWALVIDGQGAQDAGAYELSLGLQ